MNKVMINILHLLIDLRNQCFLLMMKHKFNKFFKIIQKLREMMLNVHYSQSEVLVLMSKTLFLNNIVDHSHVHQKDNHNLNKLVLKKNLLYNKY